MKRIIPYLVVLLQVVVIIFFTIQFDQALKTSKEVTLAVETDYWYRENYTLTGNTYVEYDISKIDDAIWGDIARQSYHRPLYVILVPNEQGIHEVKNVRLKRPKEVAANEVVVRAHYNYHEVDQGYHYVTYPFHVIEDIEQFGEFRPQDHLLVTVQVGKWNRYEVVDVQLNE